MLSVFILFFNRLKAKAKKRRKQEIVIDKYPLERR